MRLRLPFVVVAVMSLLAMACTRDEPALVPPSPAATEEAELPEVRLEECVIDRGEVPPAEPTGEGFETITEGVLTVGSDTAFEPFEFIEDGEPRGFDIDLITEIAERMNLEVRVESAAFDTIFQALAAGRFDVVISAVTIKEDRKQTVDFTDPYFNADQSLSVAANSDVRGIDDLEGRTVGVQAGTTGEDCATNVLEAQGRVGEVRSYDVAPDAFTDLGTGRIDAVLIDLPSALQIVEARGGAEVVQVIRTDEEYGIAVRKEQPDLRVAINEQLQVIRDDGTYAELYEKWFDTPPPS